MAQLSRNQCRKRRHLRLRKKVVGTAERPRLCVFRSCKNIYAQIIDDVAGHTLAATSTQAAPSSEGRGTVQAAFAVGKRLAEKARDTGVTTVVFDRGGYQYHGRIQALAEGAREGGLTF